MLKKVAYITGGIASANAISFGTEFLVNLLTKQWEAAVLSGPTIATVTGVGLCLRGYDRYYCIPLAAMGSGLLIRAVYYVLQFQKQFEQGKLATPPPEIKSMRTIVQAVTPEEKGLKMPGMVKA